MIVELISIGTELLLGNIVNTNAAYLAKKCAELGFSCHYQTVVGDKEEHISEALLTALGRSDVIICSGGMGHKEENKTKKIVCKMMWESDKKQKQVMGSGHRQVLVNNNGTTLGIILESRGKILIMLPGSPNEMEPMFEEQVCPYLQKKQTEIIYTEKEDESLEMAVVKILKKKKMTLTTVESCTGGAIAARIVNVPGASEVLMQGFVTYSNEAKHKLVGVKKKTLKEFGAVSTQTAIQMAEGGCKVTDSDVAISVTGIAGPGGGTKKKPVGLVYIACTCKGKTIVKEFHFNGDRTEIREQSVAQALILIRDSVLGSETRL